MNKYIEKFDSAVKVYLSEQKAVGLSSETLRNYSHRLKRFKQSWAATDPTSDPTSEDIRSYRDRLVEDGLNKLSVRQYLVELKAFFEFCCCEEFKLYEKNPVTARMFPKMTNADDNIYNKILTAEDLKKLWSYTPCIYKTKNWPRNYAMIVLLLDGKIRNSELRDLKLSDVDFEYNEIIIRRGKGGKKRWVTVSDITTTAIKLYLLSGMRPKTCTDDDYLFGYYKDDEWHKGTRQWLSQIVRNHVYSLTGKEGFASHSLRHNGAILDLNTGVRKERLQAELGHSSITTTEIYSGRLQSVRKTRDYYDVIAERDKCIEENKKLIDQMMQISLAQSEKITEKRTRDVIWSCSHRQPSRSENSVRWACID